MERIAAILAVFVLLMNGRHVEHRLPQDPVAVRIDARALTIASNQQNRALLGGLRLLAGWSLTSDNGAFGGLSSMRMGDDGWLNALTDTGEVVRFRPGTGILTARLWPLPAGRGEERAPRWRWDTESMAVDVQTRRTWIGFELTNRICRYDGAFLRVERCAEPRAMRDWPATTGIESFERLPDGRFLAIAEEAVDARGGHIALLFAGDPVDPRTPPPRRLSYRPPDGYQPTDALSLGGDRLLILNRRVTLAEGFTAKLASVDLGRAGRSGILTGPVIASFQAPLPHDNFEALALSREHGRAILWMASDDNHLAFQRTLLLKFALPDAFTSVSPERPAPHPGP